jgi:dihydrofolate reductase
MIISSIVAVGNKNAIGIDNDLPWHLPADLKFFKETTRGHFVIMGRKSFESIGKPLPGRTNLIVTRQQDFSPSGVYVFHSIPEALQFAQQQKQEEVFILGGSTVYEQTQNLWNKLYLTRVTVDVPQATAFFPDIDLSSWTLAWQESHPSDDKNPHAYQFNLYTR